MKGAQCSVPVTRHMIPRWDLLVVTEALPKIHLSKEAVGQNYLFENCFAVGFDHGEASQ